MLEGEIATGRFREAVVRDSSGGTRRIVATEGYFEEAEQPQISPDGIIRLHEVASGLAVTGEHVVAHDRYYCTFASVKSGCVYVRATGEVCDGGWTQEGLWATAGGELIDIAEWRITAKEVASGSEELGEQIDNSYENLLHCDPPGEGNRTYYEAISR